MPDLPIGRLLCVGIRGAAPGDPLLENDLDACRKAGVGGVLLFDVDVPTLHRLRDQGLDVDASTQRALRNIVDFDQVRRLVAHVRARLGDHVFVAIDQEGGRVARLCPRRGFGADPSATEFAALDRTARLDAARRQALRLRELGFDWNFAPCVDLALESENEIIARQDRSYGRDASAVIECARVVVDAHLEAGVAVCLKHFPGHGSSRGDTHRDAVDITDTWQQDEELAPYRALCRREGVSVMVAHVLHRRLDANLPASLSPAVIGGLLRGQLGFEGVVVTDSIDMRAIANHFAGGAAAVAAIDAGADVVVDGFNLEERVAHPAPELVAALEAALGQGRITGGRKRIEASLARLDHLRARIGAGS